MNGKRKIEQQPRSKIVFQRLKEEIITGEKLPGTRLIPSDLEKELQIGRVPIREALLELVQTGLVISEPYKGAIVAPSPTIEEIQEVFEIRYLLDGKAAEVATSKITKDTIEQMEKLHGEMCNHSESLDSYFLLNREFHTILYDASGMLHLCQIIQQLLDKVQTFRIRYPFEFTDYEIYNTGHEAILKALKVQDAKKAKEIVVENVRSGFETMVNVYRIYFQRYRKG